MSLKSSCAPPFCFRLTSLDELDCSFNEIEALPSSIGQCVSIRTFAADHNFLVQLPPEVSVHTEEHEAACRSCGTAQLLCSPFSVLGFFSLVDGQLEERNRAVPTFQQIGVFARRDGRHAEAQGHQSQQQQVSLN